jgi:small subunit ribosomal protein S17
MPETPEEETVETEESGAPEADAPAAPAAEAATVLPPKERRQQARARKAGKRPVRGQLTAEERQAERVAERARKAGLRGAERARSRAKAKAAVTHTEATAAREHVPGAQKTRQGLVVSDKADKTITVRIDIARRHRRYEKIVHVSRTLHVHDESNDAHVGDKVVVRESRPLSRTKRWRLVEVLERAK